MLELNLHRRYRGLLNRPGAVFIADEAEQAGGGVEQAVTNNITARLEYRYVDLGDENFSTALVSESSDVTVQSLRAGVSWKF